MTARRPHAFALGLLAACAASAQPLTRVAATTLRMPAEGTTLAHKVLPAWGGIFFDQPVQVVFAPGETTRAFVAERPGRIAVVRDTTAPTREIFLDLTSRAAGNTADHGLLTVAFHPRFSENGFFYVWFSTFLNGQRANRLSRFRLAPGATTADAASEQIVLTQLTGPGGHDGGTLLFGPDGYLYLSLGDGDSSYAEAVASHQRIDRGFFGGVIRLDVDLKPGSLAPNPSAAVTPGTFTIPPDNPFVGATSFNGLAVSPAAVRTEFWCVGLRNPWRMTFDTDGQLWCADVGLNLREEINLLTRGANYGWDYREGTVPGPSANAAPAGFTSVAPIFEYDHSQGFSITGGPVYRGAKYPEFFGQYLFADFVSGRIWALTDTGERPLPAARVRQIASESGITGITVDPRTGDVLLADFDSNAIKRLAPNPNSGGTPLPPTLAETGAFSNVATLAPAPGVVAYAPVVSFWSDYAKKSRWFAVPDLTSTFGFSATAPWTLPTGAVWIKHFDLELRRGDPTSARRVETRLLVKTSDGLYGATYEWNAAQTGATLVPDGGTTQDFTITETTGTTRTQQWIFPARSDCLVCHTERGGGVLSFNTRQLNRPGATTAADHPLLALAAAGYLNVSTIPALASLPALTDTTDPTKSLELRARSYLDANCAQCHQPGGTAQGAWDARASTPLSLAGTVNGPLSVAAAVPEDRVIVPGDAVHSVLLRRVTGVFATRMPPLASSERDLAAESLLSAWIAALATPQPASRLLNLSARAAVGTGSGVLIPAFTIAPGASKQILVRAAGPALTQFSVPGALAAPVLTLFRGPQPIATNTGWATAPNAADLRGAAARLGAFAFPENSADSALLLTLAPGGYTAQAAGANATTGIALVEVYDADTAAAAGARLTNTAVRAQVGLGASVLIPGLTVSDGAMKTVLIRAVGPGLTPFGVEGVLAEPVVTLLVGPEAFRSNTGWGSSPDAAAIRAAAAKVGAFALAEGGKDSALLVTLSPGGYTIQVSGANNTTGVALVEVYAVP